MRRGDAAAANDRRDGDGDGDDADDHEPKLTRKCLWKSCQLITFVYTNCLNCVCRTVLYLPATQFLPHKGSKQTSICLLSVNKLQYTYQNHQSEMNIRHFHI